MYGWTWPGGSNNLGQQLAIWMDFANTQENYSVVDVYRSRFAVFAERTWATSAPTLSATAFLSRWNAVGDAAGVAARPAATTSTTTPALQYSFDATSSLSSNEFTSAPSAYASTGSRAVPAVIGAPNASNVPSSTTGRSGNAVRFTGTSYQMLTVGDQRTPAQWTVGMWVRPTAATADTSLVASWRSALKLSQYSTSNLVGVTAYGVGDYNFGYTAPLNTWTHLTFVSTGTQVLLYVNGSHQATVTAAVPYPLAGGIGGQRSITGAIDDLTVFYGALDATQVATLAS